MAIFDKLSNGRVVAHDPKRTPRAFVVKVNYKRFDGRYTQYTESVDAKLGVKAARKLETEIMAKRDRDELPDMKSPSSPDLGMTLAKYLERWIADRKRENPMSRTPRGYESMFARYVVPVIGDRLLVNLRPADIREVLSSTRARDIGGTTRLRIYRAIYTALREAAQEQLIEVNPAAMVKAPKRDDFEPFVLSVDDVRKLIELSARTSIGSLVVVAAHTGMRLGELLGLRWQDVDTEGAQLTVNQSRKVGAPVLYGAPKTKASRGSIPLTRTAVEALEAHHERQTAETGGLEIVFPLTHWQVRDAWNRVKVEAGVPRTRFHDLRHAAASLLVDAGVPITVTASILRHSSPNVTMQYYAHALPGASREAVEKLDEAIAAK